MLSCTTKCSRKREQNGTVERLLNERKMLMFPCNLWYAYTFRVISLVNSDFTSIGPRRLSVVQGRSLAYLFAETWGRKQNKQKRLRQKKKKVLKFAPSEVHLILTSFLSYKFVPRRCRVLPRSSSAHKSFSFSLICFVIQVPGAKNFFWYTVLRFRLESRSPMTLSFRARRLWATQNERSGFAWSWMIRQHA